MKEKDYFYEEENEKINLKEIFSNFWRKFFGKKSDSNQLNSKPISS